MQAFPQVLVSLLVIAGQADDRKAKPAKTDVRETDSDVLPHLRTPDTWWKAKTEDVPKKLGSRVAPQVLKAFADPDPGVRERAVEWLVMLGKPTNEAIAALFRLAREKREPAKKSTAAWPEWEKAPDRAAAIRALAKFVPDDARTLPCFLEALKDQSTEAAAAEGLGELGPRAVSAIPALAKVVIERPRHMNRAGEHAAEALPKIGPKGLTRLLELLEVSGSRDAVISGLRTAGAPAVPLVAKALKSGNEEKRTGVVAAMPYIHREGANEEIVRASLRSALDDKSWRVRLETVRSLDVLNEEQFKDAFVACLKDPERSVRRRAIQAIAKLGMKAKSTVPDLIACLKDPSEGVCKDAAAALGKIGPAARDAVPALIKVIVEDQDVEVRCAAMEGLAGIGPAARPAIPAFLAILNSGTCNLDEWTAVAAALGGMGPAAKVAVPRLRNEMPELAGKKRVPRKDLKKVDTVMVFGENPFRKMRLVMASALGKMGDDSEDAVLFLWAEVEEKLPLLQTDYLKSIGDFGPAARVIFPELLTLLKEPRHDSRSELVAILGPIGPGRAEQIDEILRIVNGFKGFEAIAMAALLEGIGPQVPQATPALLKALNKFPDLQPNIVTAIGLVGPAAKEAVPVLARMLQKDRSFPARFAAAWALTQIGQVEDKAMCLRVLRAGARNDNNVTTSKGVATAPYFSMPFNREMRLLAVGALAQLGAMKPAEAVPVLAEGLRIETPPKDMSPFFKDLRKDSFMVRRYAARVLNELGKDAAPALPQLLEAAFDRDRLVRQEAMAAAKRINAKAAADAGIP